jgi:hypothetical protein
MRKRQYTNIEKIYAFAAGWAYWNWWVVFEIVQSTARFTNFIRIKQQFIKLSQYVSEFDIFGTRYWMISWLRLQLTHTPRSRVNSQQVYLLFIQYTESVIFAYRPGILYATSNRAQYSIGIVLYGCWLATRIRVMSHVLWLVMRLGIRRTNSPQIITEMSCTFYSNFYFKWAFRRSKSLFWQLHFSFRLCRSAAKFTNCPVKFFSCFSSLIQ